MYLRNKNINYFLMQVKTQFFSQYILKPWLGLCFQVHFNTELEARCTNFCKAGLGPIMDGAGWGRGHRMLAGQPYPAPVELLVER